MQCGININLTCSKNFDICSIGIPLLIAIVRPHMGSFDRLNIINLEIGDDNPQEMFESLNSWTRLERR